MKRWLAMALCLVMVLSLLAGCGGGSASTTPAANEPADNAPAVEESGDTAGAVKYSIDEQYEPWNWEIAVNNEAFRQSIRHAISRVATMSVATGESISADAFLQNTITPAGFAVDSETGKDYTDQAALAGIMTTDSFAADLALEYKAQAMEELADTVTFPVKVLVRYNPTVNNWEDQSIVLEQQLEAVLGTDYVDIIVEAGPADSFLTDVRRSSDYMLLLCNWGADYADPETWTDPFYQSQNADGSYDRGMRYAYLAYAITDGMESGDTVAKYFDLVEAAKEITDDTDARYAAFAEAEAYLIDHALVVPYGTSVPDFVVSKLNPWNGQYASFGVSNIRYKGQYLLDHYLSMDEYEASADAFGDLETAAPADTEGSVYRVLYDAELSTLNYLITGSQNEQTIGANVIDTLVEYDSNGEIQPSLATDWEYDEDTLTWTFHLREGQKWVDSNGDEVADVTAQDFVDAMKYMLTPEMGSSTVELLFGIIENAEEYFNGLAGEEGYDEIDFEEVGVKAVDDYTLQYTLSAPTPYFLSMLTYVVFMPAYGPQLEELGASFATSADTMYYNGAYYLSAWEPQSRQVYTKNGANWDAEHVYIETIGKTYNAEANTIGPEMVKRGEIDYTKLSADIVDSWLTDPETADMVSMERPSIDYDYFYCFNFNVYQLNEDFYR